jgi:hypothetical protein
MSGFSKMVSFGAHTTVNPNGISYRGRLTRYELEINRNQRI